MQVFLPYDSAERSVACLDSRRLNKQIIECSQIIAAILGQTTAWRNHPITKMYHDHVEWLAFYQTVARAEQLRRKGVYIMSPNEPPKPYFLGTFPLHLVHRARLYQKDPIHYANFKNASNAYELAYPNVLNCNMYIVDGIYLFYLNGKLIK